ncbi:ornithine carbamoyltransferase [Gammaproteobacteria bacterium LSUCC0057]|uniref:Ornithine carbamoyltransferase n=1 Tax=Gammaproteobacteria bacterium LSUCC0057 TaxID=2559237 RepID=A0A4Y8UHR4_9GAMM|nr:ornithine carbamoyltransferase [Gammaproteobacteria bacterium LSUCC0057]
MTLRHFLTLRDLSADELMAVIQRAGELKHAQRNGQPQPLLSGKVLAMIFEKSSTRTRVSFEAGMAQLGGSALFLSPNDTQLGRGEPIEDSARVISRMVDIVMIRTFGHDKIERFADYSQVPVINALSDDYHPCQLLADIQTFTEARGSLAGKTVSWVGDGNNMCHSWINAAAILDFELRIATPKGYEPNAAIVAAAGGRATVGHTPEQAVRGAHLVTTDVFASMGQEQQQAERLARFSGFQVNHALLDSAADDVLFMHCLPAHRGEEVSAELLEDERISVVWEEAENRLHAQKALMAFLLGV